jgi:hypothetical protein
LENVPCAATAKNDCEIPFDYLRNTPCRPYIIFPAVRGGAFLEQLLEFSELLLIQAAGTT